MNPKSAIIVGDKKITRLRILISVCSTCCIINDKPLNSDETNIILLKPTYYGIPGTIF